MTNETLIEYKKLLAKELQKPWKLKKKIKHVRKRHRIDQLHAAINNQKKLLREYEITKKIKASMEKAGKAITCDGPTIDKGACPLA